MAHSRASQSFSDLPHGLVRASLVGPGMVHAPSTTVNPISTVVQAPYTTVKIVRTALYAPYSSVKIVFTVLYAPSTTVKTTSGSAKAARSAAVQSFSRV